MGHGRRASTSTWSTSNWWRDASSSHNLWDKSWSYQEDDSHWQSSRVPSASSKHRKTTSWWKADEAWYSGSNSHWRDKQSSWNKHGHQRRGRGRGKGCHWNHRGRDEWQWPNQDWQEKEEDWIQEPYGTHKHTLIFLHSCHGSPTHVQYVLNDLRLPSHNLRVVAPCAPQRASDDPSWEDSFQWFEYTNDVLQYGQGSQDDAHLEQLRQQRSRLMQILREELSRLPPEGRLVLTGLSQGASMALDVLMHSCRPPPAKLSGVVVWRGMIQSESIDDLHHGCESRSASLQGLPVLATHGADDELVPISAARKSYNHLKDWGASLRFLSLRGLTHTGWSDAEIKAVAAFVNSCFSR